MPVIGGIGFIIAITVVAPHFVIPAVLLVLGVLGMVAMPEWVPFPVAVSPVVAAVVAGMAVTL